MFRPAADALSATGPSCRRDQLQNELSGHGRFAQHGEPSPHVPSLGSHAGGHGGQSPGQFEQDSPALQTPLPQHEPQSLGQVEHDSPPLHTPLPQHEPQSTGQLEQVSPPLQIPLPHGSVQVKSATVGCGQASLHVKYSPAHVKFAAQSG